MRVTIDIPALPAPYRAPYVGCRGVFKGRRETQWRRTVVAYALRQGVSMSAAPCRIFVEVIYPRPKKLRHAATAVPKTTRPDGDNLLKAIKDALAGIIVGDDAQFYDEHIVRRYAAPNESAPCTRIIIDMED